MLKHNPEYKKNHGLHIKSKHEVCMYYVYNICITVSFFVHGSVKYILVYSCLWVICSPPLPTITPGNLTV
jgi:hypothetical protein